MSSLKEWEGQMAQRLPRTYEEIVSFFSMLSDPEGFQKKSVSGMRWEGGFIWGKLETISFIHLYRKPSTCLNLLASCLPKPGGHRDLFQPHPEEHLLTPGIETHCLHLEGNGGPARVDCTREELVTEQPLGKR